MLERPRNIKAILEAARAYGGQFQITRAEDLLDQAQRLGRGHPAVLHQTAATYAQIYREDIAISLYTAMPARQPEAMAELAALYERAGRLDAALDEIDSCIGAAPRAGEPRLAKARILRRRGDRAAALTLLAPLTDPRLAPALGAEAWTERCYIHDRDGDFAGAAQAIAEAHAILRAQPQTPGLLRQAHANNRAIAAMATNLSTDDLATWRGAAAPGSRTAHLVGFPRSGTTLLEQCLDAHPGVVASPERALFTRHILPRLCHAGGGPLSIKTFRKVSADAAGAARAAYLDGMEQVLGDAIDHRVHLDKNPNHTGLIPALLRMDPHARIIFALRDPRDVVTSCVLRTFRLTEFSAMLLDWGSAVDLYAAEMNAWLRFREQIPAAQWVETRYEDMVADPMAEVRRILPTLGLPWDEAVADYRTHTEGKIVNSPTQTEVRQPIYTRAIGRWQAYRDHLAPHLPRLAPFIRAFGYDA